MQGIFPPAPGRRGHNTAEKFAALKAYKENGRKVFVGIRPERIKIEKAEEGKTYKGANIVQPELTELLGDNTNVYVDISGVKSILKVDPHDSPEMDSDIVFAIPYESVYLFDKETEKRIKLKE